MGRRLRVDFAGLEGIEPPLSVLETGVLPLNDRPSLASAKTEELVFYLNDACMAVVIIAKMWNYFGDVMQ